MKQSKNIFLWFLIAVSLVLSIRVLAVRVPREQNNRQVELALEYGDLVNIAKQISMEPLEVVKQAQDWGMTSLVLLDQDLLNAPEALLQHARRTGLILTPQLSNTLEEQGFSDLNQVLTAVYTLPNQHMLFFSGYEVYGYGNDVNQYTISQIIGMQSGTVGMVEFLGEQAGLEMYLGAAQARVIRIHPGYAYDTREELLLAVTDRNIRMIFLKPFKHMDMTSGNELSSLQQWLQNTATDLQDNGFQLGKAEPLIGVPILFTTFLYLSLGIVAALALLVSCWLPKLPSVILNSGSLAISLSVALAFSYGWLLGNDLLQGMALLASIVFPSLGLTLLLSNLRPGQTQQERRKIAAIGLGAVSLLTLIGGIITNAMLSETVYLNGIFSFRGVKIAYFLPLLATATYFVLRSAYRLGREEVAQLFQGKQILTGGILVALIGIYLARSGNDTSAISDVERTIRAMLQKAIGVRPRFKEFITGYSGLALLPFFISSPWFALGLLFLATAGQISIFNTLMHYHTPFLVSLSRIGWGFLLGSLLALIAYGATLRFQPTESFPPNHPEFPSENETGQKGEHTLA